MSLKFRIIFASSCAILAALASFLYADQVRAEAESVRSEAIARYGGEVVKLVVANEALEPGDVISKANVSVCEWVADLAPQGAISDIDKVLGKQVNVPVAKNSPVTSLAFRNEEELTEVPAGHVALSIPVTDALGLSRGIRQGMRVAAYEVGEGSPKVVAQEATVLSAPSTNAGSLTGTQVTLAVASEEVAAVLAASSSGGLRIVLPADDVKTERPEEVQAPEELKKSEDSSQSATSEVANEDKGETADEGNADADRGDSSSSKGDADK